MSKFRKARITERLRQSLKLKSCDVFEGEFGALYDTIPTGGTLVAGDAVMIESSGRGGAGEMFEGYDYVGGQAGNPTKSGFPEHSTPVTVTESDDVERIRAWKEKHKCSWHEASYMATGHYVPDPEAKGDDALREAWRDYCPVLQESELDRLVEKKIPVPGR
jgi:hypothetical protein